MKVLVIVFIVLAMWNSLAIKSRAPSLATIKKIEKL
jgi:hypothetical protein